jgi:hypothetical protein
LSLFIFWKKRANQIWNTHDTDMGLQFTPEFMFLASLSSHFQRPPTVQLRFTLSVKKNTFLDNTAPNCHLYLFLCP